jgi:hypothetical protein
MTSERQDITEDWYAGNHKEIYVTVYEDKNETIPKDLAGAEATYAILDDDEVIHLMLTSSDGATVIDFPAPTTQGLCVVYCKPRHTNVLHGTYRHQLHVVDGNGDEETVMTGKVKIFKSYARRYRYSSMSAFVEGG